MSAGATTLAFWFALDYVALGWHVFPCVPDTKRPYTRTGFHDATTDKAQIEEWLARWPDALLAIRTGKDSGLVVLDVDIKHGNDGRNSLEALGITAHPGTPTAHTPSGGYHCFFRWPGHEVTCSVGKLGPGLDIRGDGGYIVVPPGPGRDWDRVLGYDETPLAPMPEWMIVREPERPAVPSPGTERPVGTLSHYCEKALDSAVRAIVEAPAGQQHATLNKEAFSIAGLVDYGMPADLALKSLRWAASKMPSYDAHRPWTARDLEKTIADAFTAGLAHQRKPRDRRHG